MWRIISWCLLLAGFSLLLVYLKPYYGYVLIIVGPYRLESTVITFMMIGLALGIVSSVILRLLGKLWHLKEWLKRCGQKRAQEQFVAALLKSVEEDYAAAEKGFMQCAAASKQPDLVYLLAADAARQQGHWQQVQRYLSKVTDSNNQSYRLALQISWARVQLATQPATIAAYAIQSLLQRAPKHPTVRQLAQQLDQQAATPAEFSCDA
ncbi:MAG: heme biosynthesis HemY N-terminal domain-containing protein [Candidatus Symbiodolus clandestinus]